MNNKQYKQIEKHYNKLVKNKTIKTLNDAFIYKLAIDEVFSLCGVGCSLPTKKAVSSYLKHYTKQEMTEFKQDELICFTSGALTLHTWLSEGKIK